MLSTVYIVKNSLSTGVAAAAGWVAARIETRTETNIKSPTELERYLGKIWAENFYLPPGMIIDGGRFPSPHAETYSVYQATGFLYKKTNFAKVKEELRSKKTLSYLEKYLLRKCTARGEYPEELEKFTKGGREIKGLNKEIREELTLLLQEYEDKVQEHATQRSKEYTEKKELYKDPIVKEVFESVGGRIPEDYWTLQELMGKENFPDILSELRHKYPSSAQFKCSDELFRKCPVTMWTIIGPIIDEYNNKENITTGLDFDILDVDTKCPRAFVLCAEAWVQAWKEAWAASYTEEPTSGFERAVAQERAKACVASRTEPNTETALERYLGNILADQDDWSSVYLYLVGCYSEGMLPRRYKKTDFAEVKEELKSQKVISEGEKFLLRQCTKREGKYPEEVEKFTKSIEIAGLNKEIRMDLTLLLQEYEIKVQKHVAQKSKERKEKEELYQDPIVKKVFESNQGRIPEDYWTFKELLGGKKLTDIIPELSTQYSTSSKYQNYIELRKKCPDTVALIIRPLIEEKESIEKTIENDNKMDLLIKKLKAQVLKERKEKEELYKDPIVKEVFEWLGEIPEDYWQLKELMGKENFSDMISELRHKYLSSSRQFKDCDELLRECPVTLQLVIKKIIEKKIIDEKNKKENTTAELNINTEAASSLDLHPSTQDKDKVTVLADLGEFDAAA
ncbi:hypothetical protein [Candidatus Tisiphia endosymbiont of Beris chalybata]|uniref:hypothetical protein n=1 Tax=Candidatus Tisiphia endosymbiont of Beris chalybata TaxID=3066262 RepID=UPI00312C81A2